MYGPIEIPPALDWSVFTDYLFMRGWRWLCCNRFLCCKAVGCNCETRFHKRYHDGTKGAKTAMVRNMDIIQFIKRTRKANLNALMFFGGTNDPL